MDASSLAFFQQQVESLSVDLKKEQENLINELQSRTTGNTSATDWETKISQQEGNIEHLTRELKEARSTCAFIIQRERDKIHLLSSTEDALVSCTCLIVLNSERDLPQFVGEMHAYNESRGLTGVLHVFSSWGAIYLEGQRSVVSTCVTWLLERCSLVRVIHKNGLPTSGSVLTEIEEPMRARKVPNCTLHVEWHTKEMSREVGASANSSSDVVACMVDTLGRAACECIPYAHVPTYLISQIQDMRHDALNPSRLLSSEMLVYHPETQGRFIFAVASHTPLNHHAAVIAGGTLRQRLQRATGSCVVTPWGAGPIAAMAVVVNHPARNILEEAAALPEALSDALKQVDSCKGGPFAVAVSWAPVDSEEFRVINNSTASVIGWGVRKLRCMLQFAIENNEKSVFTNAFLDRLTILEKQRIRLIARVRFHRCLDADDVWAPPPDGAMSSTSKSLDEQLRHVHVTKVTRSMIARRHGLQERRGLKNEPAFDVLAIERQRAKAEAEETKDIETAFYALPSLDQDMQVLVTDAVEYWMTADAEGLEHMIYEKLRRLMLALNISHTDATARIGMDQFFVVTFRLRHM